MAAAEDSPMRTNPQFADLMTGPGCRPKTVALRSFAAEAAGEEKA